MQQSELTLDTPGLDQGVVLGLKRHGWQLVRSAMVNGEPRYWFTGREQKRQMCGPGRFLPPLPLCKTTQGAAAMLERLEAEKR